MANTSCLGTLRTKRTTNGRIYSHNAQKFLAGYDLIGDGATETRSSAHGFFWPFQQLYSGNYT